MLARDVMVSPVITVDESVTVREVAKILVNKRISAVPVVDSAGKMVGIVSESDLMHGAKAGTERRQSWWLQAFKSDWAETADYVKSHSTKITDIMTRNLVTAAPETRLHEIAALLEKHCVRRVPIVGKSGELVGIVSRADLIQVVATARPKHELHLPDAAIRQKLLDHLKRQNWSNAYNLNFTVSNGIVDLWGIIESDDERNALRIAVENVSGVAVVNDHLVKSQSSWH